MCDTMSIKADWSESGVTFFAKNSDRSPNEPHLILRVPAMTYTKSSTVQCTYISIPQVECTREVILYKPSWIWGAEMGVNDARVAIGNEAVFKKARKGAPYQLTILHFRGENNVHYYYRESKRQRIDRCMR